MRKFALLTLLLAFLGCSTRATTRNSPTCSSTDVQNTINASSAGDTVVVPSCGTTTWSSSVTASVGITLQGQTTCTGTPASSCTDNTNITLAPNGSPILSMTGTVANPAILTGFSFTAAGANEENGTLSVTGPAPPSGPGFRVHHNHFIASGGGGGFLETTWYGLVDHNVWTETGASTYHMIEVNGLFSDAGNAAWAQPLSFGTANAAYVEDNTITNSNNNDDTIDGFAGGRIVFRHNVVNNATIGFHGTDSGSTRSFFSVEDYANTFTNSTATKLRMMTTRGGTALIWNNTYGTATNGWNAAALQGNRTNGSGNTSTWGNADGTNWQLQSFPCGQGFAQNCTNGTGGSIFWCAINRDTVATTNATCNAITGGDTATAFFDNNPGGVAHPGATAYATKDQVGRTHNQAIAPVYEWINSGASGVGPVDSAAWIVAGSEYSAGVGGIGNGTTGVGNGTLAQRPATCTPLVAYWASDQNTLYQCSSTNTWTAYYTPYTYPHPLAGGGGSTTVTIPKSFFGMTQQLPTNPLFSATLPNTGIVRLWNTTCTWNAVNTAASTFTYATPCDAQIAVATNIGAQPDFVFGRTPAWAITGGAPNCTGVFAGGSGGCAQPPADNDTGGATLIAMVNSLVSHLASTHPGVHWIFECVNEAEFASEWTGTMTQLVTYCTTLRNAAHAADPQIIVLGPSAATFSTFNVHLYTDPSFNYATQAGAAASLDAINIHDYLQTCSTFCKVPESIVAAMVSVNALTTAGQPLAGKPVYFTEGDWGGGGNSASMTDAQKRQYLTRNYLYMLWQNSNTASQTAVLGKIWYAWDSTPDNQSTSFGGLCVGSPPSSCTPNQAATALANLGKWMVGATYTSPSTTAMSEDGNGTWTINLLSSPVSTGPAEIIFNATATPSVPVSSAYKTVINWDGSTTPIVGNAVTAGPDPVIAVIGGPISGSSTGGSHAVTSGSTVPNTSAISSRAWASGPRYPYAPVSVPSVTVPSTSGYTQVTATSASDLQTKVTGAACNTVISIAPGSVYTMSLVLPAISCAPGQWVFIRPTGYVGTRGSRIDPSAEVGTMPKITNSTTGINPIVCNTDVACGPFWFQDVEIEYAGSSLASGIVYVGQNDTSATPASIPGPLYFDHVYTHGRYQNTATHCFELISANNFVVVDSWVSDCHASGQDAQAINPYVGGPQLYQNDFLEGAGENILGAGSTTFLQTTYGNLIHDLTETLNWYYRPLQWNSGTTGVVDQGGLLWTVKNQHEYKACQRCNVTYSVLQNNWSAGQNGRDLLSDPFTTSANGPYAIIQDTLFQHLHIIGGTSMSTAGGVDASGSNPPIPHSHLQDRVMYDNILIENANGNQCAIFQSLCPAPTGFFQITNGIDGVIINHITATTGAQMQGITTVDPSGTSEVPITNVYMANNIIWAGSNGFTITSVTANTPSNINKWWQGADTASTPWMHNNVFPGLTAVGQPPSGGCAAFYTGTQCPAAMTNVGFTNWNSGSGGNYALTPGSAYSATGTNPCTLNADGTGGAADCGANVAAINAGIPASVTTPPANWPDFNSGGGITLTPSSVVCNGTNTIAITPVAGSAGGTGFTLSGLDVMVNGTIVTPSASSTSSLTVAPPSFTKTATITNTALQSVGAGGIATITATSGFQVGDLVTITGTINGGGVFNVTNAPIVNIVGGTSFLLRLSGGPVTSAADSGTATVTSMPVGVSNFGLPLTAGLTCN